MSIFYRILVGLLIASVGAFMVVRTRSIIDLFGTSTWAEMHMGGGGTNLFYKVIGVVVCFVGFMVATNLWNTFLQATIGSLFGLGRT